MKITKTTQIKFNVTLTDIQVSVIKATEENLSHFIENYFLDNEMSYMGFEKVDLDLGFEEGQIIIYFDGSWEIAYDDVINVIKRFVISVFD